MTASSSSARVPLRATLGAYVGLMKPHVTVLLLGTTLAAMAVAIHGMPRLRVTVATMLGGAMAAGSANAINCFWDRDIDQFMSANAQSRASGGTRLGDARALLRTGTRRRFVRLLRRVRQSLSAALALRRILFYVVIYTMWLKRTTPQNIVIGGAAGAVPVLIGWAAVTGRLGLTPMLMFPIIFLWTPPHFWALSIMLKNDYARAGYRCCRWCAARPRRASKS